MALAELLEKVSGRLRQREGSALDQLAAAANAHATGKNVDVGAVEAALVDARLDIDDFKAMCEAAVTRLEKQAAFDGLAAARTKADRLQGEIDAAFAKFTEAKDSYERQYAGLRDRQLTIEREVGRGEDARGWLLDPHNVAGGIRADYEAALERQQTAEIERGRIERDIREHRSDIRSEADWIKQLAGDMAKDLSATDPNQIRAARMGLSKPTLDKIEDHERRKAKLEAALGELEAALKAAVKECDASTAAVEAIQARILKAK